MARRSQPLKRGAMRRSEHGKVAGAKRGGTWQLQQARANLTAVVSAAAKTPQHITRNGKPVARLTRAQQRRILTPEQEAAWARTRARMQTGWPINAGPLDRDALHERR